MSKSVNFRANQRYKVLRTEQERRAKVFDRDMTSLMGYILGISCNINSASTHKVGTEDQVKYPTFAQYSSTRTFFRSESRCKRGDHNKDTSSTGSVVKSTTDNHKAGARRVKERKHVRFKAEPQIHIIEPQLDSWGPLQRPSSAPVHISKYSASDLRASTPDTQSLSRLYNNSEHPTITSPIISTKTPTAYQFYPSSPRHNSRLFGPLAEKKGMLSTAAACSVNNNMSPGVKGDAEKRTAMNKCWEGVRTKRRTRSCWETTKQSVAYHP